MMSAKPKPVDERARRASASFTPAEVSAVVGMLAALRRGGSVTVVLNTESVINVERKFRGMHERLSAAQPLTLVPAVRPRATFALADDEEEIS
jgi:hypothetical protein